VATLLLNAENDFKVTICTHYDLEVMLWI